MGQSGCTACWPVQEGAARQDEEAAARAADVPRLLPRQTGPAPKNKVELAVSLIGPGAWHSSVVVNGEEYCFSDAGISSGPGLTSHEQTRRSGSSEAQPPQVMDMGSSFRSGPELRAALESHFRPGSYDLLRKNCNSFSDCALAFLLAKRLDTKYCSLEQMGAKNVQLVQSLSGGRYQPNTAAVDFDKEKVIEEVDPEKVWKTPGHITGGSVATSAEEMRRKRLERLGG